VGKEALIRFARDGILDIDTFREGGTTSKGTADSASEVSVGDVGNGGMSSIEEDPV